MNIQSFDDARICCRSKLQQNKIQSILITVCVFVLAGCATTSPSLSSEPAQFSKPLAVEFKDAPAAAVLQTLSSYSQMYLVFDDTTPTDNITLHAQNSTLGNVFKMVLKSQCLSYQQINPHSLIITDSADTTCQRIPANTPIVLKK